MAFYDHGLWRQLIDWWNHGKQKRRKRRNLGAWA